MTPKNPKMLLLMMFWAIVAGLSLPEWAVIIGIIFVSVQCAHLLWVWSQELKENP